MLAPLPPPRENQGAVHAGTCSSPSHLALPLMSWGKGVWGWEEVFCWEPRRSEAKGQGVLTWSGRLMVLPSRFCRVQDGEILGWISCLFLIQCSFYPGSHSVPHVCVCVCV